MARIVRPEGTVAQYVWDYAGQMQIMRYFFDTARIIDRKSSAYDDGINAPICRSWRNGLAVAGGLFLAVVGALGYWGQLARDEFQRRQTDPNRFTTKEYFQNGNLIVEIRPHGGQLHPFVVLVPNADREN